MTDVGQGAPAHFRVLPVALTALVGLVVTAIVITLTIRIGDLRRESSFAEAASLRFRALQSTIDLHLNDLRSTRSLFDASTFVDRSEFRTFVQPILKRRRGIRAIERARRVPHSERENEERRVREELGPRFSSFTFAEITESGQIRTAAQRDEYFPVIYMEPMAQNERAFGLDLASNETRRAALVAAGLTNQVVASEPVSLVQDPDGKSVLVFVPTYKGPCDTREQCRTNLTGYILGAFDMGGILSNSMQYFEPGQVDLAIFDGETILAATSNNEGGQTANRLTLEEGVSIGGRNWTARCRATTGFMDREQSLLPVLTGLIGLALTIVVAGYVHILLRRSEYERTLTLKERRHQERQTLIMRELDHRVKNNLATVLSLAEQTAAVSGNLEEFRSSFSGRIRSMAHTHQALAAEKWEGVRLREIVRLVLGPYSRPEAERITIQGDSLRLSPEWSSALCMTLHELTTNAAKYGALSVPGGMVDLRWSCKDRHLIMEWVERNGPPVDEPESTGFGTRFLRGVIEYELGGSAELEFAREGLRCRIVVPFDGTMGPEEPEPGESP